MTCRVRSLCTFDGGACYKGDVGCLCKDDDSCRDPEFVECKSHPVLDRFKIVRQKKFCVFKKPAAVVSDNSAASYGALLSLATLLCWAFAVVI